MVNFLTCTFISKASYLPYETARIGYAFGYAAAMSDSNRKWEIALSDNLNIPPYVFGHTGKSVFTMGVIQGYEKGLKNALDQVDLDEVSWCAHDSRYENHSELSIFAQYIPIPYLEIFDPLPRMGNHRVSERGDAYNLNASRGSVSFQDASRGIRITDYPDIGDIVLSDFWIAVKHKIFFNYVSSLLNKKAVPRVINSISLNSSAMVAVEKTKTLIKDKSFIPVIESVRDGEILKSSLTP